MSEKTYRYVVIALAVLLAGAGLFLAVNSMPQPVEAQSATGTAAVLPRTITVVGEGTVAVVPDVASVQIGVEMTGDSAEQASADVSDTMDAVLAALTKLRIPTKDVQTSGFNIYVERPTGPDGQPSSDVIYHVSNSVTVTIRDLSKVGDVLEVRIRDIQLRQDRGFNLFRSYGGTLPDDFPYYRLIHVGLDHASNMAVLPSGLRVPMAPFFGQLAVAPPKDFGRHLRART